MNRIQLVLPTIYHLQPKRFIRYCAVAAAKSKMRALSTLLSYLKFFGARPVGHVLLAFDKRSGIKGVSVKAVLLKNTEAQFDPFFCEQRSLLRHCYVFTDKFKWQLDILSRLLAPSELHRPWQVTEKGMRRSDLDIGLFGEAANNGGRGSTLIPLP